MPRWWASGRPARDCRNSFNACRIPPCPAQLTEIPKTGRIGAKASTCCRKCTAPSCLRTDVRQKRVYAMLLRRRSRERRLHPPFLRRRCVRRTHRHTGPWSLSTGLRQGRICQQHTFGLAVLVRPARRNSLAEWMKPQARFMPLPRGTHKPLPAVWVRQATTSDGVPISARMASEPCFPSLRGYRRGP